MTIDNKRMFLTICEDDAQGYKNCDIFYSNWQHHGWSDPINLGPGVNKKDAFEGQPTITPDGKTLYFVSIREDEIGDIDNMDLYYSHLKEDGTWGEAKNLGTTINTKKNEKSPFIHEDSHTLYFSSEGHKGVGSFDIYYTKHDSLGNWLVPEKPRTSHQYRRCRCELLCGGRWQDGLFQQQRARRWCMAWLGFVQFSAVQGSPVPTRCCF
jgi:hypothetical protein